MVSKQRSARRHFRLCLLATALGGFASAADAQTAAPASAPAVNGQSAEKPSDSAMVNLVRLLVAQGVITREKGDALIAEAIAEANAARGTPAPAPAPQVADVPPPAAGTIRVPYVPQVVRDQIKEELRGEVMAQAKAEGWAAPGGAAPEWTRRITLYGDLRIRSQQELFSGANSNQIFDFERINLNSPYPILDGTQPIPFLNTRKDRYNVMRFRARLGVHADIVKGVEANFQLATGDDNGPISTNQLLAGGFGKRNIWLQEAYLRAHPTAWSTLTAGRFPNPFTHTDITFDEDLSLDGVYAEVKSGSLISDKLTLALRGGAFPLNYGDSNFVSTEADKRSYPQQYMFSAQAEANAQLSDDIRVKAAVAYHTFRDVQGKLSSPCILQSSLSQCSTDYLQPNFLRKGNTVFPVRQILDTTNNTLTNVGPEILGYTFGYRVLNATATVEFPVGGLKGRVTGDFITNLAFKRSDLCRNGILGQPLNNGGAGGSGNICGTTNATPFVGGNKGYQAIAALGPAVIRKRGEWRVEAGYRYLESDAIIDAFPDSDFHLGGTNSKGYFVGGAYGIANNLELGARWMSANEIAGDPLAIDVLQLDIQAHF